MRENPESPQDPVRDQAAVEAARAGDSGAFEELIRRYQAMVAAVAWRHGTARNEIEDVVSEVFIKMYGSLDRYSPTHRFSSWLYRLAANHVIDHHRRRRRDRDKVELPEQLPSRAPDAGAVLAADERSRLLRAALDGLADRYREPILLVYMEGMTLEAVAGILGLPVGTVKTRLMRGRKALGRVLARRHPELFGGIDAL